MSEQHFRVSMAPISRRLEDNGGDGVFVLVKVPGVKGSPQTLVADVDAAIVRANRALDRGDDVDVVWAETAMPTAKGPMINLDWVGTDEQNEEWLDTFAEAMEAAGYSGSVTAAPQENLTKEINSDYFRRSRLTAYLAYSLVEPLPPHGPPAWRVADEVTDGICREAVMWGAFEGAEVYLSEGVAQIRVDSPDVSTLLSTAVRRSWMARVMYLTRKPIRSRIVTLAPDGQACYQPGGDDRQWSDDVDAVRHPLLRAPETLDLGYARRRTGFGEGFRDLHGDPYKLRYVDASAWFNNRHLWGQYVPDPNGMQLLTRAHLEKANDLTDWEVREVGLDRFLVEARDLQPWFEPEMPDQEVIDAARADFGAMILTPEVIEADPNGWIPGRPFRMGPE